MRSKIEFHEITRVSWGGDPQNLLIWGKVAGPDDLEVILMEIKGHCPGLREVFSTPTPPKKVTYDQRWLVEKLGSLVEGSGDPEVQIRALTILKQILMG